jgi:site-specific DNA recombinase
LLDLGRRGAVACGDCGNALTACWSKSKTGKKHPYYLCHKKGCASYRKSIRRDKIEGEFADLLKALRPTKQLFDIAGKMFKHLWDFQSVSNAERVKRLKAQITKIDTDMSKLVDKLIDTENALVVQKIEDKINQMEQNKLAIVQKCGILAGPKRGYSEMFELALLFLSSPWNIWENGSFIDRRNVLKLAFTGQVPYTRENGFSNPKISLAFSVLGSFEGTKREMAHRGGFEPPTP